MMFHKLKFLALTLLLLGAVVTGASFLTRSLAKNNEPRSFAAARQTPVAAGRADANPRPAPGRMFVVGRVLDPQGKPVPGATVMVSTRAKLSGDGGFEATKSRPGSGTRTPTNPAGFGSTRPRTSSSRDDEFMAIALAPGYGVGWTETDPDDVQPTADISLRPEQVIQGRLFDLQGRPAQGVVVSVSGISRVLAPDSAATGSALDPLRGP